MTLKFKMISYQNSQNVSRATENSNGKYVWKILKKRTKELPRGGRALKHSIVDDTIFSNRLNFKSAHLLIFMVEVSLNVLSEAGRGL